MEQTTGSSSGSEDRPKVLFVDDEPLVLEGLRRAVHREFLADLAGSADEGLEKLRHAGPYAVVVSDMHMPGMDGVEFLATVRILSPDSIRVMLTGDDALGVAMRAVNEGSIFRFLRKPTSPEQLLEALRAGVAQYRARLSEKEQLGVAAKALEQLDVGTLTALARAIDAKSAWTAGHSERVTKVALKIANAMGLPARDLQIMHRGGLLHDIGKIGTPAAVLDKPGKLEPEEMKIMQDHVRIGLRILEPVPCFREILPMVAQHHERFDGSGYPEGRVGGNISLHARILAVADAYDAIISDRPYRKGSPKQQAIEILEGKAGTQFDPAVIRMLRQLLETGQLS